MNVDYLRLLQLLAPEGLVVLTALAVLFADLRLWRGRSPVDRSRRCAGLLTLGFAGTAGLLLAGNPVSSDLLDGTLVLSPVSQHLKVALLLLAAITAWLCTSGTFTDHVGEFVALVALATTGMMLLVSTENLLMVFVALELVSLSLYVMTAFSKGSRASAEAALKYFLFGGMAAAFLLLGFSLLYGLAGSIQLPVIASRISTQATDPLVLVALVLVLAGFGFKVAAVPFHPWAPDAYEGAPAPAAAFIASGSKVASFFVLGKLLLIGLPAAAGNGAWRGFIPGWIPVVAILAAASMVFGNFAALAQSRIRRLLAYSAIAHAGYALLALVGRSQPALLFYAVTYALTAIGVFGVVARIESQGGTGTFGDLAGLRTRSPLLAWTLTVFVLSLAGIPPLAGFFGKFYAFVAATGPAPMLGGGWLVAVALGGSCVSLYYYLRLLKQVWIAPAPDTAPRPRSDVPVLDGLLVLIAGLVVLLGCAPELLLRWLR